MPLELLTSKLRQPGLHLPIRTVVATGPTGRVLISPISQSDEQWHRLADSGGITDIVAPNRFHHLYLPAAAERFPAARLWGPDSVFHKYGNLKARRAKPPWPHQSWLEGFCLQGAPKLDETVFFYRATGTLICTDLCFNLRRPKGFAAPLLLRLMGTYEGFACSRLLRFLVSDREKFSASLTQMLDWPIREVLPAHGTALTTEAKTQLELALKKRGWL